MAENTKHVDYLKRLTADLRRTKRRVSELEGQLSQPVALVGMACRYPGGADSPEALWTWWLRVVMRYPTYPADRGWDVAGLFDPDPDAPGKMYVRQGSFLQDAGDFDCRILRHRPQRSAGNGSSTAADAGAVVGSLERAGIDPLGLRGTATGVFAGVIHAGYGGPGPRRAGGLRPQPAPP